MRSSSKLARSAALPCSQVYRQLNQLTLERSDVQCAVALQPNSNALSTYSDRLKELADLESKITAAAECSELDKRKREETESFEAHKRLKSGGGGGSATDSKSDYHSESLLSLSKLSVEGVSDYLRSIGKPFESYVESFGANYINGAALCKLTDSDLIELGVSNRFHRLRILGDTEAGQSR